MFKKKGLTSYQFNLLFWGTNPMLNLYGLCVCTLVYAGDVVAADRAQDYFGRIEGSVTDQTDAVARKMRITTPSDCRGKRARTAHSIAQGPYCFTVLTSPPNKQLAAHDPRLEVGNVTETMKVTAEAVLLQTENAGHRYNGCRKRQQDDPLLPGCGRRTDAMHQFPITTGACDAENSRKTAGTKIPGAEPEGRIILKNPFPAGAELDLALRDLLELSAGFWSFAPMAGGALLFLQTEDRPNALPPSGPVPCPSEMPTLIVFMWGCFGSLSVELIIYLKALRLGKIQPCYSNRLFWAARLFLIIVAGGLAVAYHAPTPLLAVHVGACTPLLLTLLAPDDPNSPGSGDQKS